MDFFAYQETARRKTLLLVVLFILAVVGIVALTYLALVGLGFTQLAWKRPPRLFDPVMLAGVTAGILAIVGGGSVYKVAQLSGGGTALAERLGGGLVYTAAASGAQRRLLNVVEEMAIASGTPTPPVYLMGDEPGINAFAAGYAPGDAVIGVTRGCAEQLSRDELQGVVAHEFSHILNGDMRLNIRLIGVLHGILVIGMLGMYMMRSLRWGVYSGRRSSDSGGSAMLAILAFGAALAAIGGIGTLFGNLIKAAVSRQREYLADASAVQFTRNPLGLAGALKKIGGLSAGSRMIAPNAAEASHMFFGEGVSAMFATHPPLVNRIRRIDPAWDGRFPEMAPAARPTTRRRPAPIARDAAMGLALAPEPSETGVDRIGRPTQAHVEYARRLIAALPEAVVRAGRDPYGARAVIYALLLSHDPEVRAVQHAALADRTTVTERAETAALLPSVDELPVTFRLPIIDLAIPTLCGMSPPQFESFRATVDALIDADHRIDFFEWLLQRILVRHLEPHFRAVKPPRVRHRSLVTVRGECAAVIATIAKAGHDDAGAAVHAFTLAAGTLGVALPGSPPAATLADLDRALDALVHLSPMLKRRFVTACATCVTADREVTARETELLRAVADTLGCPMPPLLPGQALV